MEIKLTNDLFHHWKGISKFIVKTLLLLCYTTVFSFTTDSLLSQNAKVAIHTDRTVTIFEVLELIGNQTECTFIYQSDIFYDVPKIRLKKSVIKALKLLEQCLPEKDFNISVTKDNYITITRRKPKALKQGHIKIKGKITNIDGVPIVGVNIQVKGTNKGSISNFDGSYTIDAQPVDSLIFSSLGYETQEIVVGNQTSINVVLKEGVTDLDVVTINAGYYSVTEKERTGSISSISTTDIEKQPVNNPLGAMQGYMSGVNIVQTTGVPGGGYNIQIRGKNFINGSTEPLYIIDGVPFGSESLESPHIGSSINRANVSPLNAIIPADIATIEVLKDADATAIYGSQAANGVVLISTKKGKVGKTKFIASLSSTLGRITRFRDLMNTQQYLEIRREGIEGDGFGAFLENPAFDFIWPDLKTWDQNRYTDWQKELIGGTAYKNNVQVTVSGGSTQTQFLIGGSYQKETTVFPGDANYKKVSVRNHINHTSKDQKFKVNFSTSFTHEDNLLPLADFTVLANSLEPNAPALYDDAGNLNWENNTWDNPLASLEREYRAQINTLFANSVLSYNLLPNIEVKTNLGYNQYQLASYITFPSSAFNPSLGFDSSISSFTTNTSSSKSWIVEPQINWQQGWGDAKLSVLLGSTFQRKTTNQFVQRGTGFSSNSLIFNLSAAEMLEALQDGDSEYSYQAFFGRVNFQYKGQYFINLTGRRDGSSRFGPGKQFGNFGAIGVAWLFTQSQFLKGNTVLSFGKLRGSYGTTGSDNIGDYKFLSTYNTTGFHYNGVSVLEPTGIFNPNFGWETNKKLEVALELGFFNGRALVNTSWYQNRSSNQLIGIPLAATTGFNSLTGNFDATVENTGFEFDVQTINIQSKHFTWTTNFNLTVPKNKLLKFQDLESSAFGDRYRIGEPLTSIPLFHALGVDAETGVYQFEDYNDDGGISRLDDRQWFEDLAPNFYGGLGNMISYKNVSLDFFFQFKKQKGYNYLVGGASAGFKGNGPVQFKDRWQEPGDVVLIQRATFGRFPEAGLAGQHQSESSAAISDASFIRLRNISLNYKIPKTLSFGMNVNIYLQGQNLLTITNYEGADPEQPSYEVLPPLQQITMGVQLDF